MLNIMRKTLLGVIGLLCINGYAQTPKMSFYQSRGLTLFNQGAYAEAVDTLEAWRGKYASDQGIAAYFIGESHYNLALAQTNRAEARRLFHAAYAAFTQAQNSADLASERVNTVQYKAAWCLYRLADLNDRPMQQWHDASRRFSALCNGATDSLSVQAGLLASESRFRLARTHRFALIEAQQPSVMKDAAQQAVNHLRQAEVELRKLGDIHQLPQRFQATVLWQEKMIVFERARLYQSMPEAVFQGITDSEKGRSAFSTAIDQLIRLQGEEDADALALAGSSLWRDQFAILNAYAQLQHFLLTGQDVQERVINVTLDGLVAETQPGVKLLLRGFRDYNRPIDQPEFIRLANSQQSPFAASGAQLTEAWYWLGWTQFILNKNESQATFSRFIANAQSLKADWRTGYLLEDAEYRRFLIQFDEIIGQKAAMRQLADALERFSPSQGAVIRQTQLLKQLIRVFLEDRNKIEDIWMNALQGSAAEKIDQALNLVKRLLIRATRVTGRQRQPYLDYLDALLTLTEGHQPEQSRFYRGLTQFLRAEIQPSTKGKREGYQAAATALEQVKGAYRHEAHYIQARSYFAAAKHARDAGEERVLYEKARPLLEELIRVQKSLRSLYYLGEIYRLGENHLAARACYEQVEMHAENQPGGQFWSENAKAAILMCQDVGQREVLSSLHIEDVVFPENLLEIEGEVISLERFADKEFVRRQFWQETIDLFMRYGWEPKRVFPSRNMPQIPGSAFRLCDVTYPVQEKLGVIASGLNLKILGEHLSALPQVFLDERELLPDAEGQFKYAPIRLNQDSEIRIVSPGTFPYICQHRFNRPGMENMTVALAERVSFKSVSALDHVPARIDLSGRFDGNDLFQTGNQPLSDGTQLIQHFKSDIYFRDVVFSPLHQRYLVLRSRAPFVSVYRNDANVTHEGKLTLYGGGELESPEGIDVDRDGNLYITDWKTHHIVIFNKNGRFVRKFGQPGRNQKQERGQAVLLHYPKRIGIVEDIQGLANGESHIYRPIYMLVSDINGIHLVDGFGQYWETLLPQGSLGVNLYDLKVEGYGKDTQLFVFDRFGQVIKLLQAYQP